MAKRGLMAIAVISGFVLACPTGPAASPQDPTPQEKACSEARADKKTCGTAARDCRYKFTVNKVTGQELEVTFPSSVWSVTCEKEKDTREEKEHKEKYEKFKFPIDLKQGSATPTRDKTYFFTRCPDNEFTLGEEINPSDEHTDRQPTPPQPCQ